jgi:hypothetical protein
MKGTWLIRLKKSALPVLLAGTLLILLSPATAWAQGRGGHGRSGGQAFSGRGFSGGGGRAFSGGRGFSGGGRAFNGGRFYGGGRGFYGGRYYGGRSYFFGFYGAPYVYSPYYYGGGYCNPPGYYDQWGYWRPYPGCYVPPAGYGY